MKLKLIKLNGKTLNVFLGIYTMTTLSLGFKVEFKCENENCINLNTQEVRYIKKEKDNLFIKTKILNMNF